MVPLKKLQVSLCFLIYWITPAFSVIDGEVQIGPVFPIRPGGLLGDKYVEAYWDKTELNRLIAKKLLLGLGVVGAGTIAAGAIGAGILAKKHLSHHFGHGHDQGHYHHEGYYDTQGTGGYGWGPTPGPLPPTYYPNSYPPSTGSPLPYYPYPPQAQQPGELYHPRAAADTSPTVTSNPEEYSYTSSVGPIEYGQGHSNYESVPPSDDIKFPTSDEQDFATYNSYQPVQSHDESSGTYSSAGTESDILPYGK